MQSTFFEWWPGPGLSRRLLIFLLVVLVAVPSLMYAVSLWYKHTESTKPYQLGVSYIPDYATSLGLNDKQTLDALIGINIRHFRLVSYWNNIETSPGKYDFSQLDWQFDKISDAGGTVTLTIGLRQPRWPECHAPEWIDTSKPADDWQPQLNQFITAVVKHYRDNPVLKSYQLENEYYNHFGECYNFDRSRLATELDLVKQIDPSHPVIISRSNNYVGLMLRSPLPDEIGISVYRRVWDSQITDRYFQYPFPSWYYGFLAGAEKLATGKDSVLHELQAEPWPPDGKNITDIDLAEQNKSFNATRFQQVLDFAQDTGMRQVYLWGGEYWYYRWQTLGDKSVWNVAQQAFGQQGRL